MPAGVSAQGLPVPGIRLPGDGLADPEFQGCEALVPCRERARGDQHRPHVGESAARRQHVERLVRYNAAGGDGLESALDGRVLQPVQHEVGTVDADHGLPEPVQLGSGSAARRGEGLLQSPVQAAAGALRRRQLPGLLAGRAAFPEGGVGVEAARAERLAQRASLQRRPGAALRAGDPALAAPFAYRGAGCPRDADPAAAGRPADAAGKIGTRAAGLADRPGLGDRGDTSVRGSLSSGTEEISVARVDGRDLGVLATGEAGGRARRSSGRARACRGSAAA